MIGDTFKNLKNKYTEITVSDTDIDEKWKVFSDRLPDQNKSGSFYNYNPYTIAFASIFLVFLAVTFGIAQAAKPGTLLYPIHTVMEELTNEISNIIQSENRVNPPKIHISTPQMQPSDPIIPTVKPTPLFSPMEKTNKNDHSKVLSSHTKKERSYLPSSNTYKNSVDNHSLKINSANKNSKSKGNSNKSTKSFESDNDNSGNNGKN